MPIKVATTAFQTVDDAIRAVVEILNKGVQITCVEFLDDITMKAINLSGQITKKYPETPHLFSKSGDNGMAWHEPSEPSKCRHPRQKQVLCEKSEASLLEIPQSSYPAARVP